MTKPADNCICPCCKTGHYLAHATRYIFCSDECTQAFYPEEDTVSEDSCPKCNRPDGAGHLPTCFDTANVTFGDHGHSNMMGCYLTVVMHNTTVEAFEEVSNRFYQLFDVNPLSRSKFISGEVTYYSSAAGDRSASIF